MFYTFISRTDRWRIDGGRRKEQGTRAAVPPSRPRLFYVCIVLGSLLAFALYFSKGEKKNTAIFTDRYIRNSVRVLNQHRSGRFLVKSLSRPLATLIMIIIREIIMEKKIITFARVFRNQLAGTRTRTSKLLLNNYCLFFFFIANPIRRRDGYYNMRSGRGGEKPRHLTGIFF